MANDGVMMVPRDYIFFLYSFSLLLLAVMLWERTTRREDRLPWSWAAGSALVLGASNFLVLLTFGIGDSATFQATRIAMKVSSFLLLFEFGRRGLKQQGSRVPAWWIPLVLGTLTGLGFLSGTTGLVTASRYILALPAGLLGGWVVLREAGEMREAGRKWALRLLGLLMFVLGLAGLPFAPHAPFLPVSSNTDWFSGTAKLPFQIIRSGFTMAAALAIWLTHWNQDAEEGKRDWFRRWAIPILVALLLAGGWFLANWRGQAADEDMRERVVSQAKAMARTMSSERVKTLSFTAADQSSPQFDRFQSQLMTYARTMNLTRVYTIALRDGAAVFGPNNLRKNDIPALPPGAVYKEPPLELGEVFKTHRPLTTKPFKNEYGTFVSALAPVVNPITDEVLMVIGMDIEANSWEAAIARERLISFLFILVLIVILFAGSAFLRWREGLPVDRQRRLRHAEAFLTAAIGLLLTVGLMYQVHDSDIRYRNTRFSQLAEERAESVVETMRGIHVYALAGLAKFFESGKEVTREEFRIYTSAFANLPAVEAWGWVPFVPAGEKDKVEAGARRDGPADFTIYRRDVRGNRSSATGRGAYYPVLYVEPLEEQKSALGFDLGSEPSRRGALQEAARTGLPTITDPIILVTGSATQKGALVFDPVSAKGTKPHEPGNRTTRTRGLRGFALAVLRLEPMLNRALGQSAREQSSVNVDLYQLKADEAPLWLASSSREDGGRLGPADISSSREPSRLSSSFPLFAFGKVYAVVVHAGSPFMAVNPARQGWAAGLVGLLLTAFMTSFIGSLNNRRAVLESLVLARTAALRESEQFNRQIIAGARDGIVVYDCQFNYLVWNPFMEALRGVPASQVLGKNAFDLFPHLREQKIDVLLRRALAGESIQYSDRPYHNGQTGKFGWFSATFGPHFNSSGEIIGVIGILRDTTERRRTEEALFKEKEKFQILSENAPFGMVMINQAGSYAYINPKFKEIFGYDLDDIPNGKTWFRKAFPDPIYRREVISAWLEDLEISKPGQKRAATFSVTCKDGTKKVINFIPVQLESGDNLMTCEDITERKRAEEALRESEKEAQRLVQENAVMAEIGRIISSTLNIEEVYERFAAEARKLIPFDRIAVSLNNPGEGTATIAYASGVEFEGKQIGDVFPLAHSGTEEVLRTRAGFLLQPEAIEELEGRFSGLIPTFHAGLPSMILAPLISRNQIIGVLHLRSKESKAYSDRNLRLAERIGAQVAGAIASAQLLLERKRAEEALRESEQRWQFALEGSGDGVWDWDAQTNKFLVSRQYKVMLGFEEHEFGDHPREWTRRIHSNDWEQAFAEFGKYLRGEIPVYVNEHRLRCKDGSYKWVLARGKIVRRTPEDIPSRVIGTLTDITERKQAEEALRLRNEEVARERRNLELIFASVQVGLLLVDVEGVVRRVNDNFSQLVGRPVEEILGRRPGETFSCANLYLTRQRCGDTPQCQMCPVRALLSRVLREEISVWGLEVNQKIVRDGEPHSLWLNLNGSPLKIDGQMNVLLSVIDITSRKNLELSLEQAKEAAEAADRAKSEFLAHMSHEIRTPMNGVVGMSGLLLDTELTPKQRQYAQVVRSSGESLLSIINEILDFSKIEAHKLDLDTIDFDLRTTLEDVTEMLAIRAQEKGLEMVCLISPEVPSWLRGDPGRLRQIIVNLGGNAVKFTHHGGVTIQARLAAEDDHRATVRFTVSDTGIGIPKAKLSILFSPFAQVDRSITHKYGGTGLGLAISKQLVELMGGQIGVESEEGQGSSFWFTAVLEKQGTAQGYQPQPMADLNGLKALVVDDHEANRALVTTLLSSWGCRPFEATDGKAALVMLLQAARDGDPFRVALLDNLMPETHGPELGRMIKADPEIRDTRLIMMTSLAQRGDAARLEEIGFSGYLTKPLRQSHLRECLALVMGQESSPVAKAGPPLVTRHTVAEARKRRIRILLAEDNSTNQLVLFETLQKLGYRTDVVADGKEAIETLKRLPYDLVLMDCEMPELDGLEATRIIRNWKLETGEATTSDGGVTEKEGARDRISSLKYQASSIPIIAITAYAMKGDRERCLAAGMNDYLSKPIQPEELARVLDHWLAKKLDGEDGALLDAPAPSEPSMEPVARTADTAGEAPAEEVIFDRGGFLKRIMGDKSLARKMMNGFLADMPVQIEKLKAAIDAGDSRLAGRQGHRIKGAAGNLGGMALRGVAFSMERAGKAGDLEALRTLLPDLQRRFAELKDALENGDGKFEPEGR